jgi:hypothetical protein
MNDKARIPKGFYIPTDKPVIGDIMKHNRLIDKTFREAVIEGYDDIQHEMLATTVMLPVWLRREVSIINLDTDISQGKLYTAMVHQGTALLQEMTNPYTNDLHGALRTLTASTNSIVVDVVQNFAISVNGIEGGSRRSLRIPVWCKSKLGQVGGHLRMEYSSLIRLSMYLAIQRFDGILEEDKVICDMEITRFEKKMREYAHVCNALASADIPRKGDQEQ